MGELTAEFAAGRQNGVNLVRWEIILSRIPCEYVWCNHYVLRAATLRRTLVPELLGSRGLTLSRKLTVGRIMGP